MHPFFIFHPPEFEIRDASTPSSFSVHFGEEEINFPVADISMVLNIETNSVGPEAPSVLIWSSMAASDRPHSLYCGPK